VYRIIIAHLLICAGFPLIVAVIIFLQNIFSFLFSCSCKAQAAVFISGLSEGLASRCVTVEAELDGTILVDCQQLTSIKRSR
jgi:hypothetical protein